MNGGRASDAGNRARAFRSACRRQWQRLLSMLPKPVRAAIAPSRERLLLHADAEGWRVARAGDRSVTEIGIARSRAELRELVARARRQGNDPSPEVVRLVAVERILFTPCDLPAAAERRLRTVLGYEMDRYTPFTADQVCFDHLVTAHEPGNQRIEVNLYVALATDVEEWLAEAEHAGVTLDRIDVVHAPADDPFSRIAGINLLRGRRSTDRHWRPVPVLNAVLGTVALVLLAAAMVQSILHENRYLRALQREASEVSEAAQQVRNMRQRLRELDLVRASLAERFEQRHTITGLLALLSRQLPNGTHVTELRLHEDRFQLAGYSDEPAGVISVLEGTHLFRDTRFQSSATEAGEEGAGQRQRFSVQGKLVVAGGRGDGE